MRRNAKKNAKCDPKRAQIAISFFEKSPRACGIRLRCLSLLSTLPERVTKS